MLYSAEQLSKELSSLGSYLKRMETTPVTFELEKSKARMLDVLDKASFYLKDLLLTIETSDTLGRLNAIKGAIRLMKSNVDSAENINNLIQVKDFMGLFDLNQLSNISVHHMNDKASDLWYNGNNIYDLDAETLRTLRMLMGASPLNCFFIECKRGFNASTFAMETDTTYGITDNRYDRNIAKSKMTRVIPGKLKGSLISNGYFDVVFTVPYIGYVSKYDYLSKLMEPCEKVEIRSSIKYLRPGGVFCTVLPATRVDDSLALWLSRMLSDDTQLITLNDELERVIIIGQKEPSKEKKEDLYQKLRRIDYDNDTVDIDDVPLSIFKIPQEELVLEYFRGSQLVKEDVIEACNQNSIDSFLNNQTQPLVVKDQSPLLPFNIGQVGLVLTSGCLDGIVKEGEGVYHVIKGMTTKLSETRTEVSDDNTSIKSTETISNQVKINVFTADGEFISLG